jgi:hypothetical protein
MCSMQGRRPGRRETRPILLWALGGAGVMIVAGSALHFAFGWAGGWRPLALVAAVNESIWEHLKLAFWPGLAWAMLTRPGAGLPRGERLAAAGIGLSAVSALIVAVFTGYTEILGTNLLALDIGTFVLAVLAGQGVVAALLRAGPMGPGLVAAGLALLLAQVLAFSLFTFHPPAHWLFVEAGSGLSGLPPG